MEIDLGKLEHINPRTLWASEPGCFTPWLARNIGLLSEALGIDLELLQTEKDVGNFSCDIHARDINRDRPVIIENQLAATDHTHLGQLITYAAGLEAAVIVWISPEVREEHREAIDWLNRRTDDQIEFFAIALEVIRIDNSRPSVQFTLVASPNSWSKTVAAKNRGELSDRAIRYREFFQGLIDQLRTMQFTNAVRAQPKPYYSFSSQTTGFWYVGSFSKDDRLRAELYIDVGDKARNKQIFDYLQDRKQEIENKIGTLNWEKLEKRRASRISLERPGTNVEIATSNLEEVRQWLVKGLFSMKSAFGEHLQGAVQAAVVDLQEDDREL